LRVGCRQDPKRAKVSFRSGREIDRLAGRGALTPHSPRDQEQTAQSVLQETRADKNTGADEVTSISYLPATFTTLFFLAAGLLLGFIQ
jgi:hypothetical protein